MLRGCFPLRRSWTNRNRKNFLVVLTFVCAVILLVWRKQEIRAIRHDVSQSSVEKLAVGNFFTIRDGVFDVFSPHDNNPHQVSKVTGAAMRHTATVNASTYAQRKHRVVQKCGEKLGDRWKSPAYGNDEVPHFSTSPIISTKHNLMYCPVGKVASSFFTRVVLAMNKPGPMTSPLLIPMTEAGRGRCESLESLATAEKRSRFLRNSTKIVFGKDPFSRILSAYVDKLFSPNPFYWRHWGRPALALDKAAKRNPCSSHVTFTQFIEIVLKDLYRTDVHLKPVYEECKMCDVLYDVVGQVETTTGDLDYLGSLVNVSFAFQHSQSYPLSQKMDTVLDAVNSVFSWTRDVYACMSSEEMGRRLWRKFQIRGIFDSSLTYPFSGLDIEKVGPVKFTEACKSAILKSTDGKKLRRQRKEVLREAFSVVNSKTVDRIRKAYAADFDMFGYDPFPHFTQERDEVKILELNDATCFDVFKDWNVL